MIKAIVFDLDGTLLNTIEDITDALNVSLGLANLPKRSVDEVKYFVGSGAKKLIERAISPNGDKFNEVYDEYIKFYSRHNSVKTKPYANIIKVLKTLKKLNFKLAVFSNKPHVDTESVVNKYFPDLFDVCLGATPSNKLKPEIDGLIEIKNNLGVELDEIIYVGDSEIDVVLAKNAGVRMIGCLWGFRKRQEISDASYFASNPLDLLEIIAKVNNKYINGVLLFDKRSGITSQDALIEIKRALENQGYYIDSIGHAGTLDPLASGLLVVLLNSSTKLSDMILGLDKEYIAEVELGKTTDTLDVAGKVLEQRDVSVNPEQIDECLASFIGEISQIPPQVSAIKVGGKKLYEYARSGKNVTVDARCVTIYDLKRTTDYSDYCFSMYAKVSKGTYVRSLARDIGEKLGTYGIVKALRRIKSHDFDIKDAYNISDVECGRFTLISEVDSINLKKVELDDKLFVSVSNGREVYINSQEEEIAFTKDGRLVAIYEKNGNTYRAKRVWKSII